MSHATGWVVMPNSIITDGNLDVYEFRILSLVMSYQYKLDNPEFKSKELSLEFISKTLGIGNATAKRRCKSLVEKEYIRIVSKGNRNNKTGTVYESNISLTLQVKRNLECSENNPRDQRDPRLGSERSEAGIREIPKYKEPINKQKKKPSLTSEERQHLAQIKDYWNEKATGKVRKIIGIKHARLKDTLARLKERPDVNEWKEMIDKIMASKFLTGGGSTEWAADFNWFVRSEQIQDDICEGRYDELYKDKTEEEDEGVDMDKILRNLQMY